MEQISLQRYRTDYELLRLITRSLLVLTVLLVFLPLYPAMPTVGGDPSWMFGMNQAVAQGLVFGKDIVFPLGPYASVYTKVFHPGTDHLMLLGGLVMGIAHAILLYKLTKSKSIIWHLAFICIFSAGLFSRDVLLYFYPLLLALFVYQQTAYKKDGDVLIFISKVHLVLLFMPLGLLVLIKGSTLVLAAGVVGMGALLFWIRGMKKLAISACVAPVVAAVLFLLIAGQPVSSLWHYFTSMLPVTSGYTGAMYVNGPTKQVVIYIVASLVLLYFCFRSEHVPLEARVFLTLSVALYLFTAFKGGFTRHDGHALTSAGAIIVVGFLLHTVLSHKRLIIAFIFSAATWLYISYHYVGQNVFNIIKPVPSIYTESVEGLILRTSEEDVLLQRYHERLAEIRREQPSIPVMEGTTDLYSYEQTYLLATENKWSPRPVLQSYSVYTDKLARMNEAHLVSNNAPDNIIFRLQTIDNRIPALDDGLSWPTIINNYQPGNIDVGFMYLKRKRGKNLTPKKTVVFSKECGLNEEVVMPGTSQMLFAQFDVAETLPGKLVSALYQPEPLNIYVTLADGSKRTYRFIPGMSKSGFVLSPLVESIDEFGLLFNNTDSLKSKVVKSFRIAADGIGFRSKFISWKTRYTFRLSKVELDQ